MKKGPPAKDKRSESEKDEEWIRDRAAIRGITVEEYKRQRDAARTP